MKSKCKNPNFRPAVEHIFTAANFINHLGIKLKHVEEGYCEAELDLASCHTQHLGRIHGGVLATLSGHAATGAVTSLIPADKAVVAMEFKINLLRAISGKHLFCRGQVIMPGNKSQVAEAEIFDGPDASGKLVAKSTFTFMVIDGSIA